MENIDGIIGAEAGRAFSAALQTHRGESLLFLLRERQDTNKSSSHRLLLEMQFNAPVICFEGVFPPPTR